jgi:uroporphyrinogen decarboxylase
MPVNPFETPITPDGEAFLRCLKRQGTPERVHFVELIIDGEVQDEICRRYHLLDGLDPTDPTFKYRKQVIVQSFLGYDYVVFPGSVGETLDSSLEFNHLVTEDTADMKRDRGRSYIDEHKGPITNWKEFEAYPWPDLTAYKDRGLDWCEHNLPDNMIVIGGLIGAFFEDLSWLMGYETLCMSLYDQRDLVKAISDRIFDLYTAEMEQILKFKRVKVVWGSDDMGFKNGTMIGPKDMREFVLPGHRRLARMAHDAGRMYILHSCGKLDRIMDDLVDDIGIDGKHSYEDTITDVRDLKATWGQRIAILGGIDMDFLCRAGESQIRQRVRDTLDICQPGGGYMLGTGNTVANYVPLENYLIMLDEGRKYRK